MFDPLLIFVLFMCLAAYLMFRHGMKLVLEYLETRKKEKEIRDKPIEQIEW